MHAHTGNDRAPTDHRHTKGEHTDAGSPTRAHTMDSVAVSAAWGVWMRMLRK